MSDLRLRLKGRSFRNIASTAAVNLGAAVLTSVGGIFLARELGPTDRGGLVTILLWPAVVGSLASLGLTQSTCYWVARRRAQGLAIMSAAARAALATGLIVAVVGTGVAPLVGRTPIVTNLVGVVFLMSPVFIAGGVWMSTLQAVDIGAWNRSRTVQPISYFVGIIGLALAHRLTLTTVTATFCCTLIFQALHARYHARRSVGGSQIEATYPLRSLYEYGVRVWASTIPKLINVRLDQLALSILPAIATSDLGIYAVAASLSWLALPAATAFGSVAFPAVASSTNSIAIRRIERVALLGSAGTAAAVLVAACLVAPFAVPRLIGPDFDGVVVVLWLLAPGTVFLAVNRVLADLLQGRGRPLVTSVGEGSAAVLTIVLLVALTPRFGIRGAAVASTLAYPGATIVLYAGLRAARRAAEPMLAEPDFL